MWLHSDTIGQRNNLPISVAFLLCMPSLDPEVHFTAVVFLSAWRTDLRDRNWFQDSWSGKKQSKQEVATVVTR